MSAIRLADDPSAFLSAAVTLSPVLLLTTVLVTRRALAGWTGRKRKAWAVLLIAPAYLVLIPGVAGLAAYGRNTFLLWVVLLALFAQIAFSLYSFWSALLDQSLPPS